MPSVENDGPHPRSDVKERAVASPPAPPPTVWHELFSRVPEKRPQCLSPARTSGEPRCFQNEIAHTQMKKKKKIPSARPHWTENGSGGLRVEDAS